MLPHQNPVYAFALPHTCYMPRPSYSRFYHPKISYYLGVSVSWFCKRNET
jgi:hypothetical protein